MRWIRTFILVSLCVRCSAQTSLSQTTLSANATINQNSVYLSSTTALTNLWISNPQAIIYIDQEAMLATQQNVVGNRVAVSRGWHSTQVSPHNSGAAVFIGTQTQFLTNDPQGACTSSTIPFTPWINLTTGNRWTCANSLWTLSGGPYFVPGSSAGSLADPTVLTPGNNGGNLTVGTTTSSNDDLLAGSTPSVLVLDYPISGTQADIIEAHTNYGNGFSLFAHSVSGYQEPQFTFYRSHGTRASPTVVANGDAIMGICAAPYTGTSQTGNGPFAGYLGHCSLYFFGVAEETMSATAAGSYYSIQATAPTTTTPQTIMDWHALNLDFYRRIGFHDDNARDIGSNGGLGTNEGGTSGFGRPHSVYVGSRIVGGKPTAIAPSAGTLQIDVTTGSVFVINVNAAITTVQFIAGSDALADGQIITLIWEQDGSGHAVSGFNGVIKGAGTPSSTASSVSTQQFVYDSVKGNWYALAAIVTGM